MSDQLPENLAEYSAAHRNRDRNEKGWVRLSGKQIKKWKGLFYVYRLQEDGSSKRLRRLVTLGTKAEIPTKGKAEEALRLIVKRELAQPMAESRCATVADLCEDYLTLCSGDWGDSMRSSTTSMMKSIIKPAIGHLAIGRTTAEDLKRLVNDLPNRTWSTGGRVERGKFCRESPAKINKGVSVSYAKKVITTLRAIFDLASERDFITKNPARSISVRLRVPKQVKRVDKSVFPPQYLPVLLAELSVRDRLIVWLSILGATRPNELFAVRGGDVGPGWIHIERALSRNRQVKETKTNRARFIHLPPDLAIEVEAWMQAEKIGVNDWLFQTKSGIPVRRDSFLKGRLRPAAKRAMIPVLDVDFQMLRRSFATLAQFVKLDVKAIQSQLGHARPDMTAREYMQPIDGVTAQQLGLLEDMLRGRVEVPADVSARLGTVLIQ